MSGRAVWIAGSRRGLFWEYMKNWRAPLPTGAELGRHGPGDYFFDWADGFELPEVFGEFVFGEGLKEFPSGGSVDQHDALDEFSFGHNRGLPVGVWRGGRRRFAATPVGWMRPVDLARRIIFRASGYRRASRRDLRRRKCEKHYGARRDDRRGEARSAESAKSNEDFCAPCFRTPSDNGKRHPCDRQQLTPSSRGRRNS